MSGIIITVKDKNNTYTARGNNQSASCTYSADQAASRLAGKIFGGTNIELEKLYSPEKNQMLYRAQTI